MESAAGIRTEDIIKLLQRENELLNSIIQSASDSIFAKDLEGRYLTINETGAKILGLEIEDVIGRTDKDFEDIEADVVMSWDAKLFETGKPVEYESQRIDGTEQTFYWTSKSPLMNNAGEMIGLIGVSRNITDAKRAEDKYEFIFENAPIAMWEEDFSAVKHYLDHLKSEGVLKLRKYFEKNPSELEKCIGLIKVLNVNRSALQMNGVESKEELLPSLRRNFTPESESIFVDELVALGKGETEFQKDGAIINEKGDVVDVVFNLSVLPGHEQTLSLVLVTLVDVTDIRKMASELSNIKHRYQSIVEAQTEMICRLNPKGKVLFENIAFNRFFKHKQAADDARFVTLFPPDELEQCESKINALSAASPTVIMEIRNYDEYGKLVWQEWSITAFFGSSGVLLGYQAVGTDITDRKMAEEALAASEARWRSVFNHADDLIITFNTDGYILSINDYKSLPKEQKWAGRKIDEVLDSENANRVMQLLNTVVVNSSPLKTELDIVRKDGNKTTFGVALSPIMHGKRVISVVCIARDITETKRFEKRTKEVLIEGQEKERMRVSQELHDGLGQLFTAIKLNLQQIRSNMPEASENALLEGVEMLESNIGVAITEVKNISRNLMPDVLWQFGLKPAIEDLIDKLKASLDVNLSLEMVKMNNRFSNDLEKALFRICQELINNSIRHGKSENIYVQFINHENTIMLMVEDDGVGFDLSQVSSGSGLQNIRSRVEVFEGLVEIDSSMGKGTVTTIEIPLTSELTQ